MFKSVEIHARDKGFDAFRRDYRNGTVQPTEEQLKHAFEVFGAGYGGRFLVIPLFWFGFPIMVDRVVKKYNVTMPTGRTRSIGLFLIGIGPYLAMDRFFDGLQADKQLKAALVLENNPLEYYVRGALKKENPSHPFLKLKPTSGFQGPETLSTTPVGTYQPPRMESSPGPARTYDRGTRNTSSDYQVSRNDQSTYSVSKSDDSWQAERGTWDSSDRGTLDSDFSSSRGDEERQPNAAERREERRRQRLGNGTSVPREDRHSRRSTQYDDDDYTPTYSTYDEVRPVNRSDEESFVFSSNVYDDGDSSGRGGRSTSSNVYDDDDSGSGSMSSPETHPEESETYEQRRERRRRERMGNN